MYKTLATFGCSWTRGVGAHWNKDNDQGFEQYHKETWNWELNDPCCFKGLLSKQLNLENFNISMGGASNDFNFYNAEKIFGDPIKRKQFIDSKPIVLWGITSTARIHRNNIIGKANLFLTNEDPHFDMFWDEDYQPNQKDLAIIKDNPEAVYRAIHLKYFYDHNYEVDQLANKIELWNTIFESYDIPVIWFDTFNTHSYYNNPKNFLQGGDLLTQMLDREKIEYPKEKRFYHLSTWVNDDPRLNWGVHHGLLNPYSYHPSSVAHKILAKMLKPSIEAILHKYSN